jgi:hypothetical protein
MILSLTARRSCGPGGRCEATHFSGKLGRRDLRESLDKVRDLVGACLGADSFSVLVRMRRNSRLGRFWRSFAYLIMMKVCLGDRFKRYLKCEGMNN